MSIIVNVTEQEILNLPNDSELGEFVRQRYWREREQRDLKDYDDEKFIIFADETGLVKGIHIPKESHTNDEYTQNGYDKCVVCGKVSPYKSTTHIALRVGYVEGGGQGCFEPKMCEKVI
jgi:hypothetical protein